MIKIKVGKASEEQLHTGERLKSVKSKRRQEGGGEERDGKTDMGRRQREEDGWMTKGGNMHSRKEAETYSRRESWCSDGETKGGQEAGWTWRSQEGEMNEEEDG